MAEFNHTDDQDGGGLEQNEIILFQCKSCNAVLADSSDSDGANSDLGVIVLCDVPETLIQMDREESEDEDETDEDNGCEFSILSCTACDASVGKFYTETTEEFTVLQNRAALDVYRLNFHTIDSSKFMQPQPFRSPAKVANPSQSERGILEAVSKLRTDVKQVQFMMCNFDQRIRRIEKLMKLPDIIHNKLDASADTSLRSGNVTLNSSLASIHQQGISPSRGSKVETSRSNKSLENGRLDTSTKSDTHIASSQMCKQRRQDLGQTWTSENGTAATEREQRDMELNGSPSQRMFYRDSSKSHRRREDDSGSPAHAKKVHKRRIPEQGDPKSTGKKKRIFD